MGDPWRRTAAQRRTWEPSCKPRSLLAAFNALTDRSAWLRRIFLTQPGSERVECSLRKLDSIAWYDLLSSDAGVASRLIPSQLPFPFLARYRPYLPWWLRRLIEDRSITEALESCGLILYLSFRRRSVPCGPCQTPRPSHTFGCSFSPRAKLSD